MKWAYKGSSVDAVAAFTVRALYSLSAPARAPPRSSLEESFRESQQVHSRIYIVHWKVLSTRRKLFSFYSLARVQFNPIAKSLGEVKDRKQGCHSQDVLAFTVWLSVHNGGLATACLKKTSRLWES